MGLLLASPLAGEGGRSLGEGYIKMENKVHQKTVLVQFEILNFRPNCHPEFFTLYLLACSYYSKLKAFTPQGLNRM